jgi:hypothetical protein
MPNKVSEKKLAVGIICILIGLAILLNTKIVSAPIKVSEAGIFLATLSLSLIAYGVVFLRKSMMKL